MSANIRIDADARAALAEFDKLARKQTDIAGGQDRIASKSRDAAGEERRLGNLRRKLLRDTENAQERFTRKLEEAKKSLDGTKVSEERLGRIRDKLHGEYLRDLEREDAALEDVSGGLREVEDEGTQAFGVGKLTAFAGGLLSVSAVGSKVVAVITQIRDEADAAAEALGEIAGSSGNLAQLAGGDEKLLDKLFASSDEVFASGFVRTREEADKLIFELQSAGRLGDIDFFSSLAVIDNAAALAKSANLIATGFGASETGGSQDIISKAIAAALPATGVTPSDIASGVARAAGSAKGFGLSDEELFAAVSRVAEVTGSGAEAGTLVNQLLQSGTRQGLADQLQGQGLASVIRQIGSQNTTQQGLVKFLGSSEALRAFDVLRDIGSFRERASEIETSQAEGLAKQAINNALRTDRVGSSVALRSGEAQNTISQDDNAVDAAFARARLLIRKARQREAGESEAGIALNSQAEEVSRLLLGDRDSTGQAARENNERLFIEKLEQDLGRDATMADILDRIAEGQEEQTRVIKNQSQGIPVE